jgi:hypothetical protein
LDDDGGPRGTASVADTEELQTVRDLAESMSFSDLLFHLYGQALGQFHHTGALGADQMVVMPLLPGSRQFIAGDTITKIKSGHHPHALQCPKIPINRRQIAFLLAEGQVDFLVGERVLVTTEDLQDGLAWPRDFP